MRVLRPWDHHALKAARRRQPIAELYRKAARSQRRNVLWITIEEMDLHEAQGGGLKPREQFHVRDLT